MWVEPGLSFSPSRLSREASQKGAQPMMAIDDLLDRGRDARRRREEAASELAAVLQALEGLAGVDMLEATQQRELSRGPRQKPGPPRLRDRPRARRASGRRKPAAASA